MAVLGAQPSEREREMRECRRWTRGPEARAQACGHTQRESGAGERVAMAGDRYNFILRARSSPVLLFAHHGTRT